MAGRGEVPIAAPVTRPARLGALVVASHPGPSLVISAIIVALAAGAGATAADLLLLAPAAVAQQLSIGWSNDAFDAPTDIASGRQDKPIVRGAVSRATVLRAGLVALGISVAFSFAAGVWPGLVNLAMVALGWAYNVGLKSRVVSGLLYVLGFGLIPVFATSVLPGNPLPRPWTILVAALLGLGGHFANVLPDLTGDLAHDVRGLPQVMAERFGPFAVRVTAFALVVAGAAVIAVAGRSGWVAVAALAVGLGLSAVGLRAPGRIPFFIAMGIGALDAVLLVLNGSDIVDG